MSLESRPGELLDLIWAKLPQTNFLGSPYFNAVSVRQDEIHKESPEPLLLIAEVGQIRAQDCHSVDYASDLLMLVPLGFLGS